MEPIHYLALGDSYTIGTGLDEGSASFPSVLARHLTEEIGIPVAVRNLGINGYTTADLIREELPAARTSKPEVATVLIGANDIVQDVIEATYRDRVTEIYRAIVQLNAAASRVLAISIPDFSKLPGAAVFGPPESLHARISTFNDVARSEADANGLGFVDITTISTDSPGTADWLAADNLHPGPTQHRVFADRIWEVARERWVPVSWDRWSQAAKTVLEAAQTEAVKRKDSYIGTEHVLLGLFTDRYIQQRLGRNGLTYEKANRVLDKVLDRNRRSPQPSSTIPTSRVRHVIRIATAEAVREGAASVEPQHILSALIIEGEDIVFLMLRDAGVRLPVRLQ